MRKSKINWGFTLVEVLIALVIMTAVITISVGAFQMFNPANSDKDTNVLDRTVDLIGKQKMFRSLRAAQHYSTRDDSNTSFLVFMGEQNYLLFVTANPLTPGSKLSIGLLQTSVSNETGSISLIYCEYPFGEVDLLRLKYKSLDCSGQSQYVFMDNLRQVEFEYFGWKDRAALFTAQTELLSEIVKTEPYWQSDYSAMEKGILPNYMRIRFLTEQQNNSAMYFRIGDEDPRIAALSFGSFDE